MSNTQEYVSGAEVDFTKGNRAYKYSDYGRCRIVSIRHLRVWTEWQLEVLDGPRKGDVRTFKTKGRTWEGSYETFAAIAPLVAKASKAKIEKVHEAIERKYAKETQKFERTYSLQIEPGDIIEVTDTRNKYDAPVKFRVYEVDLQKNRIKGWRAGQLSVGSKMGYYSTAHDNMFEFKIVQKAAFDVHTDPLYIQYKNNTANAGAKRANTRARHNELKDMFGW